MYSCYFATVICLMDVECPAKIYRSLGMKDSRLYSIGRKNIPQSKIIRE